MTIEGNAVFNANYVPTGPTDPDGAIVISARGGQGVWNQNGGLTIAASVVRLGQYDVDQWPDHSFQSDGTLNLNGGEFRAPQFSTDAEPAANSGGTASGTVNFNGGRLTVTGSTPDLFATTGLPGEAVVTLNVMAGGAIIDANGNSVGITQPLVGVGPGAVVGGATSPPPQPVYFLNNGGTASVLTYAPVAPAATQPNGPVVFDGGSHGGVHAPAAADIGTTLKVGVNGRQMLLNPAGLGTDLRFGKILFDTTDLTDEANLVTQIKGILTASYGVSPQVPFDPVNSTVAPMMYSTTAAAQNATKYTRAIGWWDNSVTAQVEVMYTMAGDCTGDGIAGGPDLTVVLGNFGKPAVWATGDFNYDGTCGGPDLTILLANFGKNAVPGLVVNMADYPNLDGSVVGALQGAGVSVVPEPSTIILLSVMAAAGGLWGIVRRRRNNEV